MILKSYDDAVLYVATFGEYKYKIAETIYMIERSEGHEKLPTE